MSIKDTNEYINNDKSDKEELKEYTENNNISNDNNEEPHYKAEAKEFKDKYLRSLAELENLKKYSIKQLEEANSYAISKFAKELLTVMDIFNKALDSVSEEQITDNKFKAFINGINLTKQEFTKILTKFGITALDSSLIGQNFDPNYHEALMSQPGDGKENNTIFTVFEAGYKIKDKLLRPAKVGIIKNT